MIGYVRLPGVSLFLEWAIFELIRVVILPITTIKVSEIRYRRRDQEEGNGGGINESPTDDSEVI